MGFKAGAITFIGDCLKSILAIVLVRIIYANTMPDSLVLLGLYAGTGAVLGHNFPIQLKFKGGKGVATSAGIMFVLAPISILISILFFFLGLFLSKKTVSIGSTCAAISFPIVLTLVYKFAPTLSKYFFGIEYIYMLVVALLIMIFIIIKHIPNYKRMLKGEEKNFDRK